MQGEAYTGSLGIHLSLHTTVCLLLTPCALPAAPSKPSPPLFQGEGFELGGLEEDTTSGGDNNSEHHQGTQGDGSTTKDFFFEMLADQACEEEEESGEALPAWASN